MDIFDVLSTVSKRRINLMKSGITKHKALIKAERVYIKNITYHYPTYRNSSGMRSNLEVYRLYIPTFWDSGFASRTCNHIV